MTSLFAYHMYAYMFIGIVSYLWYLRRMMFHSIAWSNDPLYILNITDINIADIEFYRGLYTEVEK